MSYGFTIVAKDFERTWGAILVIKEEDAQDFANGWDQNNDTFLERSICEKVGITLIDGLGEKVQSSSWLLN